jgi:hypothetical protein
MSRLICCLIMLVLAHCGDASESPDPAPLLALRTPATSDHGTLVLGSSAEGELSRAQASHTWQFALTADAQVTLATQAAAGSTEREVDTVLLLRALDADGTPHWLAQNDDVGRSRYSRIVRALPAGHYQATVYGYTPNTRGRFAFVTRCSGAGCPAADARCWFGDTFSDLRAHPSLVIASETWITSPAQLPDEIGRAQVVLAVQQSTHTEVTTVEDAIAVVDQREVRRMELHDDDGSVYLAFEYGAGDNSYGAIFAAGSTDLLASIHDGDLLCARHE